MPRNAYVAIDSNCLTYLVDAMYSCEPPTDDLGDQKIALLRTYLYRKEILYISSTVQSEYQKIKDALNKERHEGISTIVLGEVPASNPKTGLDVSPSCSCSRIWFKLHPCQTPIRLPTTRTSFHRIQPLRFYAATLDILCTMI